MSHCSSQFLPVLSALRPSPFPPTRLVNGHPAFSVHCIMDLRCRGRGFQYLFDWEGYGLEERSWVPLCNILDAFLLRDFYRAFLDKPDRASGVDPVFCSFHFCSCLLCCTLPAPFCLLHSACSTSPSSPHSMPSALHFSCCPGQPA